MKLRLVGERTLPFRSYTVYDDDNNIVYTIKQKRFEGTLYKFYGKNGEDLSYYVYEHTFIVKHKYYINYKDKLLGTMKYVPSWFKNNYVIDFLNWRIEGSVFAWHAKAYDENNNLVFKLDQKAFQNKTTYEIEVEDENSALYALMFSVIYATVQFSG